MTLGQKQRLFSKLVAMLILRIYLSGYEVTLGHALRSVIEATRLGKKNSIHTKKLGIDLNLFKNGTYLSTTSAHHEFGAWWEHQHPLCRWGGRFGDGNHYSLEHRGVK